MEQLLIPGEKILKVPEAAEILRISRSKAYQMVRRNEIPHVRLGGRYIVSERLLYIWIEKKTYGG